MFFFSWLISTVKTGSHGEQVFYGYLFFIGIEIGNGTFWEIGQQGLVDTFNEALINCNTD